MNILQHSQHPIAYALHRTHLLPSVAYHTLFLLSRLKMRYPAASCAFGHRLFLTSYMLSSKIICNDAYLNKVSASHKKIAHTTMNSILNLVLMLLPSAPVTVDPPVLCTMYSEPEDLTSKSIVKVEALW